ncbi:sensor histidine kinase [Halorhodospira halophila]|uniref:histidine kinase n=1 Tax=Halorhodospira halophila (strain DSM 244 / SL1) TaxID=349124 RepID=A1WWP4_HALHL|nr:HAMP domain-containing sensor histidine kinase [Halorhodospira halophila]ABM62106.1 signal transduction histidine kinase [Halorhodospira halophila SL1]MBK1729434.1 sensor histidine kinase [Halorhodospira halophila]
MRRWPSVAAGLRNPLGPAKSLLRLLLTGFAVVAAPLILALAIAAWSVDRLASDSQIAIYEAVGVTENSAHMARVAMDIERAARRYATHNDPTALQEYRHWRRELAAAGAPPGAFGPEEATWLHQGLRVIESTLLTTLHLLGPDRPETAMRVPELSLALHRSVASISAAGYRRIDEEVEQVQAFSDRAHQIFVWHLLAAVPITLAFTFYFAGRIHRPIQALGDSIRRLGTADFERPVEIRGPRDLENLGGELDDLRRQLADLQNQRQRLLRHFSHELKTPLAAVLEGAELLRDPAFNGDPQRREEIADIVRENGHELRRQIDNLLRFARHGEALARPARFARLDLSALVHEVAERHQLTAQRRGIEIRTHLEPAEIEGDRELMATVVDNLLSNALRFSPENRPIDLHLRGDDHGVILEVQDRGQGIPEHERSLIFEPFRQGATSGSGSVKGSGLGLSLVHECLNAHNGTIHAQTRSDGPGANMRVWLPTDTQRANV